MTGISEAMFSESEMAAVFSGPTGLQRMLDAEAALARAQARAGLIPEAAAEAIASHCRAELFDLEAVSRDGAAAGTPVIPLVRSLGELVGGDAQGFVHWGATSQDIIDTAMVLQMRDGLDLLGSRLMECAAECATLAERHRRTPMAGRTLLQHAVPITFGLKAARWLALIVRLVRRLGDVRGRPLTVQLGGAAGTLAAMGGHGLRVMELMARELGLGVPDLPWHAERDRVAEVAAAVGAAAAGAAKIGTDIILLSQTEVGEASPRTAGGSSAMPHKRNPTDAVSARACGQLALGVLAALLSASTHEHERAAGGWQAEWHAVPEIFLLTAAAAHWTHRALSRLEVHPAKMEANVALTRGQIMTEALVTAMAPRLGRDEAYAMARRVSEAAVREGLHLRDAAAADPRVQSVLSGDQLDRALDVSAYLGSADALIDRALEAYRVLGS